MRSHRRTRSPSTSQFSCKRSGSQSSAACTHEPAAHRPTARSISFGTPPDWRGFLARQRLHSSERAATSPIRTARAAPSKLAGETSRKVGGAEKHLAVQAHAVSNQLPGMNRWCRIRCRRCPRAPRASRACGADIATPAEAAGSTQNAPRTRSRTSRNGPAHSAASLVSRRHVPRVPRCGGLPGSSAPC